MVLTDGKARSVEGIVKVFDNFARASGLCISMEKTTIYLAGVTERVKQEIADRFHFASGQLPVRYLGLPLVTKRMTEGGYLPLLETIRKIIGSWRSRYLSYAGRLELIRSILWSITNFWLAAFRLPRACINEIDKLCSAFLWSGTELIPHKAKVAWVEVCKPKEEGGLGLRSLREMNDVCCLKLLWRIASNQPSLWVKWVKTNLLKSKNIWSAKDTTSNGSWIWRKILKYKTVGLNMYRGEPNNGSSTSFSYDNWSSMGNLIDVTGPQGFIDLGISQHDTIADAWDNWRRRNHRVDILNSIENNLQNLQLKRSSAEDVFLWKGKNNHYRPVFSTKETWKNIRISSEQVDWHRGTWFTHNTPKHSFCVWLAMKNKLSTGDRILKWNGGVNANCVLCNNPMETRDHLFFLCSYSSGVWHALMGNLLQTRFSLCWNDIMAYISDNRLDRIKGFLARYVFQLSVYSIWRERNVRRHDETPTTQANMIKSIDK